MILDKTKPHQYVVLPHLYAKKWEHERRKPPPYAFNFTQMYELATRILHKDVRKFKESL